MKVRGLVCQLLAFLSFHLIHVERDREVYQLAFSSRSIYLLHSKEIAKYLTFGGCAEGTPCAPCSLFGY